MLHVQGARHARGVQPIQIGRFFPDAVYDQCLRNIAQQTFHVLRTLNTALVDTRHQGAESPQRISSQANSIFQSIHVGNA